MEQQAQKPAQAENGKFFTVFVDDGEYHFDHSPVTGGEIMDAAGIPYEVGLYLIEDDGTQQRVEVAEEVELKPGRRFKKAPQFRGDNHD